MLTPEELTFCSFTLKGDVFCWVTPDGKIVPMKADELKYQLEKYFDKLELEKTVSSHLEALGKLEKDA